MTENEHDYFFPIYYLLEFLRHPETIHSLFSLECLYFPEIPKNVEIIDIGGLFINGRFCPQALG